MTDTTRSRQWPLWTSAAVLALTAVVHIVAGTPEMLGALADAGVAQVEQSTLTVVWHLTSVLLVTFPVALIWATRVDPIAARPLLVYVWTLCVAFVVVFLMIDVMQFGGAILTLPQWTLFVPPAVLLPMAWVRVPQSR